VPIPFAVDRAQIDTGMLAIAAALADLTAGRVRTADDLRAHLDRLELAPYRDAHAAAEPSRIAAELAAALGDEQLQARVQLVRADVLARQGKAAESGRLLFATSEWAQTGGDPHVLARSHYLRSTFYRLVGDLPSALEHALHALESTPADVLTELRAEHLLTLALALDESGNAEEADRRYREVAEVGLRIGHPRLSINALNNMAYVCCEEDHPADAVPLVARMREIAAAYGTVLNARHTDTAAKVQLMLGAPEVALEMLATVLAPEPGQPPAEPEPLAQCLLTAAEAQRALGRRAGAHQMLDRLVVLCEQQQLRGLHVAARLERSLLFAADGRFPQAYEEHVAFHAASEALRSVQREARARILQIALGVQQARQDTDHFRELALRDPLTGLHNRRYLNDQLTELLERCGRLGEALSVAMFDLDHFKRVNDTLSHDTGDAVLVAFAALLAGAVAAPAVAARLGGEEFLVILPRTGEAEVRDWTARTLSTIRAHDWSPLTGRLPVTASVGLSTVRGPGWTREELLRTADENLYAAKHSGRDRFVGPEPAGSPAPG
jgi:two-component system cell cycle response regulator